MATNNKGNKGNRKPANTTAQVAPVVAPPVVPNGVTLLTALAGAVHGAPAKATKPATKASWRAAGAACMGNTAPGKCQHVWQWCHNTHAAGGTVSAAAYGAAHPTANVTNNQIEVGLWAQANGVVLARAPRKASVTVATQPQA